MELVELLLDPAHPDDPRTHATVAAAAALLGLRAIDAAAVLSERHPRR